MQDRLRQFLYEYKNKNSSNLFVYEKFCDKCNISLLKDDFNSHLNSKLHFDNANKLKIMNDIKLINFVNGY